MLITLEGFLGVADHGLTRVLTPDGAFVDINRDRVVATEWLGQHSSGLSIWRVDHSDDAATHGLVTELELDSLFIADGDDRDVQAKRSKRGDCWTLPVKLCEPTRDGPC